MKQQQFWDIFCKGKIRGSAQTQFQTYRPELDAAAHSELHGPAHYVDALVSTNDGLAVPFNVQVIRCTAGDLTTHKT